MINSSQISRAACLIKAGEVVAFPTETVYGLCCDAFNLEAVARIYEIKNRPPNLPMQVMVSSIEMAKEIAVFNDLAEKMAEKFWAGPLTLVLKKKVDIFPDSGLNTVGIRIPNHDAALSLLNEVGIPLAASSANTSGEKESLAVEDIDLQGVSMILDGGRSEIGISSTVIDLSNGDIKVLRKGVLINDRNMACNDDFMRT